MYKELMLMGLVSFITITTIIIKQQNTNINNIVLLGKITITIIIIIIYCYNNNKSRNNDKNIKINSNNNNINTSDK